MADGKRQPQPGDLIEIDRPFHQHWALYMGDGYVIHLTPEGKQEVKQEGLRVQEFIRAVKKELLVNVAGKNQWYVNNKSDKQHNPLPVEKIISHAEAYIGKEVTYRSFGSNCERFVKKLRYGEAFSEQVMTKLDYIHNFSAAATVTGLIGLSFVPSGALVASVCTLACVCFACNRIAHCHICAEFRKPGRDILEKSCC